MGLPSSLQRKRQPAILGNRSKLPKSTREELGGRNHYGCGWARVHGGAKTWAAIRKMGYRWTGRRTMFPTLLTGCKQVEGEQPPRWPLPSGTWAFAWGQIRSICVAVMQPQMLEQSLTTALHWAPTAYLSRTVIFRYLQSSRSIIKLLIKAGVKLYHQSHSLYSFSSTRSYCHLTCNEQVVEGLSLLSLLSVEDSRC